MTVDVAGRLEAREVVRIRIERTLRAAGVEGVIPTPLDAVAAVAGITEVVDIRELNELRREGHRKRRVPGVILRRLMGAVFFPAQVVLVDTTQSGVKQRWTEAHELAHKILPWHEQNSYLDDDETLSVDAKEQQEQEANVGAAELLFQGWHFRDRCLSYRQGIDVPLALSTEFATSITATMRYYVETHERPMALLCLSQYVQNQSLRVVYGVESPDFMVRFGPVGAQFPSGRVQIGRDADATALALALREARRDRVIGYGDLLGIEVGGFAPRFEVEAFFNGYNYFVLLKPRRMVELGRRLTVRRR